MRLEFVFIVYFFSCFQQINAEHSLKRSSKKAEELIVDVCESLFAEHIDSDEDKLWEKLCQQLIKAKIHRQKQILPTENEIDEFYEKQQFQPRRSRSSSRSSSRSGSRSGSRSSGGDSGSRSSSSIIRYRSRRTGATISKPTGSLWSRTRYSFLLISRRYIYRSSSYNRYTTPSAGSETFYYCTSNSTNTSEIQCSSTNGDNQCCDDETYENVFCCGGKISEDLDEDFNQAKKVLARIFYTLSAVALVMHIFMRRFRY